MIFSVLASMLLTFSNSSIIQNTFYNYGAKVSAIRYIDSLVGETTSDNPYYFDSNIKFYCDLSYDDENSYYISNCKYTLTSNLYSINGSTGDRELDSTFICEYTFDWEITPSSYLGQFDKVSFRITGNEDDVYLKIFYDQNEVASNFYTPDDTFKKPVTENISLNTGTVLTNSFIYQIEQWLTLKTGPASYDEGYDAGRNEGYQNGYTDGYTEASSTDSTAVTIFSGILNIGLMPINFFLGILNFEVFGINIGGLVAGLLTIAVTLIVVRIIFSGGNGNGDSK